MSPLPGKLINGLLDASPGPPLTFCFLKHPPQGVQLAHVPPHVLTNLMLTQTWQRK